MAIISFILMISTNDLAKLLYGEIRCWSLSEFKGLNRLCKSVKKISFQWSNNIAQQFLIQTICLKILSLLCSFKVNNETFPSLKILSPSLTYIVVFLFIFCEVALYYQIYQLVFARLIYFPYQCFMF